MGYTVIADRHGIASKIVSLTFDDGPSQWTPPILDHFAAAGSRATFFVLGEALKGREAIIERTLAEGHELAVHGTTHVSMPTLTANQIRHELAATRQALAGITDAPVRFWRPPYLHVDDRVGDIACEIGFCESILCSIDPSDWTVKATEDGIVDSILGQIREGSIVDLHDGRPTGSSTSAPTRDLTIAAVGRLLPNLEERGYRSVTLSELLAAV